MGHGSAAPETARSLCDAHSQALREDRVLHEIHATSGDIRCICDLFGLSVEGATRCLNTVEHPDLTIEGEQVPRA